MTHFSNTLRKYSNPRQALRMTQRYLGKKAKIYPSNTLHKKYKIFDPHRQLWVHFGQLGYDDFTKHKDKKRRKNYLTRSKYIRGNWQHNKYSPNNLSRHILW